MEGFIAKHPSGKEEWIISRHGRRFRKVQTKETGIAVVYRTTITTYFDAARALGAFHAEKSKAKSKGFNITDYDSTTPEPQQPKVKSLIKIPARTVSVLGHRVPLDDL